MSRYRRAGVGVAAVLVVALIGGCSSSSSLSVLRRQADDAIAAGDCERAASILSSVLSDDPTDVRSLTKRAGCEVQSGEYNRSVADASSALRLSPTLDVRMQLAQAYWYNGQLSSAWSVLRAAAEASTVFEDLIQIATVELSYGDASGAHQTLAQLQPADRDFQWYLLSGRVDSALHHDVAADGDFSEAVAHAPEGSKGPVFASWGDSLWQRAAFRSALAQYNSAIAAGVGSDTARIYSQIASCESHLGDLPAAVASLHAALRANPSASQRVTIELDLAQLDLRVGNPAEVQSLVDAISRDPHASPEQRTQAASLLPRR